MPGRDNYIREMKSNMEKIMDYFISNQDDMNWESFGFLCDGYDAVKKDLGEEFFKEEAMT
jgi:hypothetical protein